jgi:succinyl-CoA synthetase beta subunit
MNIHEYQAKAMLGRHGVPVPVGAVAASPAAAVEEARRLGLPLVVKAQIHAGARGKAGGIRAATSLGEIETIAAALLGSTLVTEQTGPEGKPVDQVYLERAEKPARELYVSLVNDRRAGGITISASAMGGMEIEKVAHDRPDAIISLTLMPGVGLEPYHARKLARALGLEGKLIDKAARFLLALSKAFAALDATMVEVNPWALTEKGDFVALDAKMAFDANALFRQPEILSLRDKAQEDPFEAAATEHQLNYVRLEGDIGCMVNGAGLAMATMDLIDLYGGHPANFLDVAGSATPERIAAALRLVASDPKVRGILVNIFGGMMRCNAIAEGLVMAIRELKLTKPLVVRLEGTNVEEGRAILETSNLPITVARSFDEAAARIVALVKEAA